ncbi:nitroreductase family protein [Desulfofundulus thermobenzoicus]|uniref:Nitroreductase family protein n=1 Tax=Desulfofundulus thermobenzoicus TaxID=29376 RepID=A0A6N7IRV9_9FIRM|nr:nitroreductase family protein [Desulfofundulus thermobenzoicus]MQL52836.1 nitroreductase family protein [Desulfofundulus thermobenzoicus]HHW43206.1 nitroreductase family protein [Desulfotomaculum sp.]
MSQILSLVRSRYSVRHYKPDEFPRAFLDQILEAARWAPSAGNLQPWFFYVVTRQEDKEALAQAALNQRFIVQAPVVIVVCAEPERSARVYGERGRRLYCYQDTAAAVQNMLLTATALGLGACWVGAFDEERVGRYLGVPAGRIPVAIVPVGYPADDPSRRPKRREIEEIVSFV